MFRIMLIKRLYALANVDFDFGRRVGWVYDMCADCASNYCIDAVA